MPAAAHHDRDILRLERDRPWILNHALAAVLGRSDLHPSKAAGAFELCQWYLRMLPQELLYFFLGPAKRRQGARHDSRYQHDARRALVVAYAIVQMRRRHEAGNPI